MDKMGAEMAQLSSMEQLQNLNQTMKQMLTRDQPMERMAMTSMIGKTVTVDRDRFPFTEGSSQPIKFNLPMDASRVTLTIVDQSGSPVVETDLGPQRKGEGGYLWDGKKANSLPAKSGNYTYRISAADASGNPMKVGNAANVRVVGVSFEGQKPVMLVGDPNSPDKVFMENVVRIIDHSGSTSALIPPSASNRSLRRRSPPSGVPSPAMEPRSSREGAPRDPGGRGRRSADATSIVR
jgi:flagellar hook assembly protein FlgD